MNRCISIVIPTYNRASLLREVLPFYFLQNFVLEVIVIDDGSSDSYQDVCSLGMELERQTGIKFFYKKNKTNLGVSIARNRGISLVRGQYILWGEDDAFLREDYTDQLLKLIMKYPDSFIFGSIYYGITVRDSIAQRSKKILEQQKAEIPLFKYSVMEGYYRKKVAQEVVEVPFGHALILVPVWVYKCIHYDNAYRGNAYREESDVQVQMLRMGLRSLYTSTTECYHYPTLPNSGNHKVSRISQEFYKILNTYLFYRKHYEFLRSKFHLNRSEFEADFYYVYKLMRLNLKKVLNRLKI